MKNWFKDNWLLIVTIILISIFVIAPICYVVYKFFHGFGWSFPPTDGENPRANWGTFGDFFGGVLNPILGFASFIALLYTVRLQSKELKNSNEQLTRSAIAQTEMEKTQKIQQFEGLFTFMVSELGKLQENIVDKNGFSIQRYIPLDAKADIYERVDIKNKLRENSDLVKYFIYLYQVLKLINSQDEYFFPYDRKKQYSNIVRAGVDSDAMRLLFLNCLTFFDNDFESFKTLLEKFAFFEHLNFQKFTYTLFVGDKKTILKNNLLYLSGFYNIDIYGDCNRLKRAISNLLLKVKSNEDYEFEYSDETKRISLVYKNGEAFHDFSLNELEEVHSKKVISSINTYSTISSFELFYADSLFLFFNLIHKKLIETFARTDTQKFVKMI